MRRHLFLLSLAAAVGCAPLQHRYDEIVPTIPFAVPHRVAVGVQDWRREVRSGERSADFVGIQNTTLGPDRVVATRSGAPLAAEFSDAVADGLRQAGARPTSIDLRGESSPESGRDALLLFPADRFVLLAIRDWRIESTSLSIIAYDLRLDIFDASGALLAWRELRGRQSLGRDFLTPQAPARQGAPTVFRAKLEELFNDPHLVRALGPTERAQRDHPPSARVHRT